ncbi:MAG TPA: hypothetical protein P5572_09655, partial [Phycisphaerae bacterium]|nr:hypothetical protein [Phycisphaerae bacterium]
ERFAAVFAAADAFAAVLVREAGLFVAALRPAEAFKVVFRFFAITTMSIPPHSHGPERADYESPG